MSDYRSNFIYWYFNEFQLTDLYKVMSETVEDSPWHRERNVATHTDMVVSTYLSIAPERWEWEEVLGGFACAFHDVGKPMKCQHKFKPERGDYKAFNGHEQASARLWEDWAVQNFWSTLTQTFQFNVFDIYRVGWIIEKHLPWGIKKSNKLRNMALTCLELFPISPPTAFTNMLLADTYGRMSDDYTVKREKTQKWNEEFITLVKSISDSGKDDTNKSTERVVYLPIAASGSGKTTFLESIKQMHGDTDVEIFSWDSLRMEFYLTSEEWLGVQSTADLEIAYHTAFERQREDKEFINKANRCFIDTLKLGKSVIVDNTNLSKKRRRFFVDQAARHGYRSVAILMPSSLQTILTRQSTRTDKTVPLDVVERQYMSLQLPEFGEVDDIWVVNHNIPWSAY